MEERAAALYRGWAAEERQDPRLCNLWTALAREEEEHARSLRVALRSPAPEARGKVDVSGWEDALAAVGERLTAAENLGEGRTIDDMLAAALELEMTELDTMRRALLALAGRPARERNHEHAEHLAEEAYRLSTDGHVRLLASLLLAESRVKKTA